MPSSLTVIGISVRAQYRGPGGRPLAGCCGAALTTAACGLRHRADDWPGPALATGSGPALTTGSGSALATGSGPALTTGSGSALATGSGPALPSRLALGPPSRARRRRGPRTLGGVGVRANAATASRGARVPSRGVRALLCGCGLRRRARPPQAQLLQPRHANTCANCLRARGD